MEEGTAPTVSEPPPLPYSLRDRKKSIAIFWAIFVVDTLGQPLALYWALWYATDLSHNLGMSTWPLFTLLSPPTALPSVRSISNPPGLHLVFSIVTASLGGVSVFEYFYRLYNLFRKNSRARPLNARRSWVRFALILLWDVTRDGSLTGNSWTSFRLTSPLYG